MPLKQVINCQKLTKRIFWQEIFFCVEKKKQVSDMKISRYPFSLECILIWNSSIQKLFEGTHCNTWLLKVDRNEKSGDSGRRQLLRFSLALWRWKVNLIWTCSFPVKLLISVSACYSLINKRCLDYQKCKCQPFLCLKIFEPIKKSYIILTLQTDVGTRGGKATSDWQWAKT